MKVKAREELILEAVTKIMAKGRSVLCGELEFDGQTTIQGGTSKRKAQYVKTAYCIPHEAIRKEVKEDISVIQWSYIHPMAVVPLCWLSEKGVEYKHEAEGIFRKKLDKVPRIKAALHELMAALEEEAMKIAKEEKINEPK
jgi:hypothetical protein